MHCSCFDYSLCTVDSHNVTKSNTMNIEEKEEILQFLLQTFDQVYLPGYLVSLNFSSKYERMKCYDVS